MAERISSTTVDTNKSNGQPVMEFSGHFLKTFDQSLSDYDERLNYLNQLVKGNNFVDDYGVCNCRYQMIYVTPHDLSSYVSYIMKAISKHLVGCNICDMEKLSVELAKRFVMDNGGKQLENDVLFATSTYVDPRTQTLMDILVQTQNTFFERCVYSKYEMQQRAKDMKNDVDTLNSMHFSSAMKAVVKALPNEMKKIMKEIMERGGMACCDCELVMMYIETFVLFMCSLNACTVEQMIGYVQPMSTFLRKAKIGYHAESYTDGENHAYEQFITECCIIKTNEMNIRARIPFDCNMKNVVLQDVTPNFKDTHSALHFMIHDNRSPIAALLVKYVSEDTMKGTAMCVPELEMLAPYFRQCNHHMTALAYEYDKAGFNTDVNWLDKIAYGNQFMDGNYRMDAMGNENRHPIRTTLEMLHKMYCGCGLKSSEELANHIMKIEQIMNAVIRANWCVMNRQLTTDILAVLGDCFTRCVLKLYHNNCVIIANDDCMPDTMIPGYTYCESFVYMEADNNQTPTVTVNTGQNAQNTAPKQSGLNKLASMLRQFANWIKTKLAAFFRMFLVTNEAKIKYITSHKELNDKIGQALGKGFNITMNNVPMYKVPAKQLQDQLSAVDSHIKTIEAKLTDGELSDQDIAQINAALYPTADIAKIQDEKQRIEAIQNYVLFGTTTPTDQQKAYNGPMDSTRWNDIIQTLTESGKLIDTLTKTLTSSLQKSVQFIEKIRIKEANQQQQNQNQQNGQQTPQHDNAQKLYDIFQQVLKDYDMNMMNTLAKTMFNTYYSIYKKIVDAYQSQKANIEQPATNGEAAAETAETPATTGEQQQKTT